MCASSGRSEFVTRRRAEVHSKGHEVFKEEQKVRRLYGVRGVSLCRRQNIIVGLEAKEMHVRVYHMLCTMYVCMYVCVCYVQCKCVCMNVIMYCMYVCNVCMYVCYVIVQCVCVCVCVCVIKCIIF